MDQAGTKGAVRVETCECGKTVKNRCECDSPVYWERESLAVQAQLEKDFEKYLGRKMNELSNIRKAGW